MAIYDAGIITLLILYFVKLPYIRSQEIDGSAFRDTVQSLVNDGVGARFFQEYLTQRVEFTYNEPDGAALLRELIKSLYKILQPQLDSANSLAKFSEGHFGQGSNSPSFKECCTIPSQEFEYDLNLQSNAYKQSFCYSKPSGTSPASPFPDNIASFLLNAFKANLEIVPNLGFQYIGTEEGYFIIYPGSETPNCYSYDPRLRPWYGRAASNYPRDIVVVVDMSKKMGVENFGKHKLDEVTKQAVNTILDALSSKDRLALIPFANPRLDVTHAGLTNPCFINALAPASERLKADVRSYLNALTPDGDTLYGEALKQGFKLLRPGRQKRDSAVIFITGAEAEDRDLAISAINEVSGYSWTNMPHFLGYTIGLKAVVINFVQELLQQYGGTHAFDKVLLESEVVNVAYFYKTFSLHSDVVSISPPYIDFSTSEYVMTITKPIVVNSVLRGVVGIDINMHTLLAPLVSFQAGLNSYAFLFDLQDYSTLFHPLIPLPGEQGNQPSVLNILLLERGPQSALMVELINGKSGQTAVITPRYIPKGNPYRQGVRVININSTYFYDLLVRIPGIAWEVCIVLGEGDKLTTTRIAQNSTGVIRFFYHRTDLKVQVDANGRVCRAFYRRTTQDRSSVKFAPKSYLDPAKYLYTDETKEVILHLIAVVEEQVDNDILQSSVIDDVALTSILDQMWTTGNLSLDTVTYAVWRYIGTQRGMHRVFPSSRSPKAYDPSARPWYKTAISRKDQMIVTPPYLDDYGAGYICTAAQTIFESDNKSVFGVMAIDVSINYIQLLLEMDYAQCKQAGYSCFIIGSSAYIVSHSRWIRADWTYKSPINVQDVPITELEPGIAKHMIETGYLIRKTCTNLDGLKTEAHYEVNVYGITTVQEAQEGLQYSIAEVSSTNLFVILKTIPDVMATATHAVCPCSPDGICQKDDTTCECPCYKKVQFDLCTYAVPGDNWIPCPPVPINPFGIVENFASGSDDTNYFGLPFCGNKKCSDATTVEECHSISYCRWCSDDVNAVPLTKPFCGIYDVCWFGQRGRPSIYPLSESKKPSYRKIIIISTSVLAAFILITIIVLGWLKKSGKAFFAVKDANAQVKEDVLEKLELELGPDSKPRTRGGVRGKKKPKPLMSTKRHNGSPDEEDTDGPKPLPIETNHPPKNESKPAHSAVSTLTSSVPQHIHTNVESSLITEKAKTQPGIKDGYVPKTISEDVRTFMNASFHQNQHTQIRVMPDHVAISQTDKAAVAEGLDKNYKQGKSDVTVFVPGDSEYDDLTDALPMAEIPTPLTSASETYLEGQIPIQDNILQEETERDSFMELTREAVVETTSSIATIATVEL